MRYISVALGNFGGLIRRIATRKKSSQTPDENYSSRLTSKGKRAIVLGIVIAAIGFAGAIYFGSQFVKEEVNAGGTLPYTLPTQIKSVSPIDLEIVFVVIGVIGFAILLMDLPQKLISHLISIRHDHNQT